MSALTEGRGSTRTRGVCASVQVAAQLRILASAGSGLAALASAQSELRKRMAARLKESQLPVLQSIAALPAMTLMWREGVDALLEEVSQNVTRERGAPRRHDRTAPRPCGRLPAPVAPSHALRVAGLMVSGSLVRCV